MRRLLLDTHALVWATGDRRRLGPVASDIIVSPDSDVFVSDASAWEIAIKVNLGRMGFPLSRYAETPESLGFSVLAIATNHALAAGALPRHHGDPFDRMLVAQAALEGLTLVTSDAVMAAYGVPLLPAHL